MEPQRIGRYEVTRELGRGGMATVYLARDPLLGRDVAIKLLPRQFIQDTAFLERFRREARAVATLGHDSAVAVFDSGEHDGQPYLVMEHMPGGTLAQRLRGVPWPLADVAAVLEPVADALDSAHRLGIVHRDLKPANILFDASGRAHVADFGIVQLADSTQSITGTAVIGTPAYMSPEQCQGDGDLTPASDLYALGVIAYELATGRPPFTANSAFALLRKHIEQLPVRPGELAPGLPEAAEAALLRALAKDPGDRFPSAREFVSALAASARRSKVEPPVALLPASSDSPTRAVARTVVGADARPVAQARRWKVAGRRVLLPVAALAFLAAGLGAVLAAGGPDDGGPPESTSSEQARVAGATPDGTGTSPAATSSSTSVTSPADPDRATNASPAVTAIGAHFLAVGAGEAHSCALRQSGTIVCWGSDDDRQLDAPDGRFTAIASGWWHNCAIRDDARVLCWGSNRFGESNPPEGRFTAISAGQEHTCGVTVDHAVLCWGLGRDGRTTVPSGAFNDISVGLDHTCGLRTDGTVSCWGWNGDGQATPPSGKFVSVASGVASSCAVDEHSVLKCWGYNGYGAASPPAGEFSKVSVRSWSACGIVKATHLVVCWGFNNLGQSSPPMGEFIDVSVGDRHACGITSKGDAVCWGSDIRGQLTAPR